MDIKLQLYRGDLPASHVDFRKEGFVEGEGFRGSPEDEHRTAFEGRITDEDLSELGITQDEFLASLRTTNKVLALVTAKQHPSTGNLASLVGLGGAGPVKVAVRAYEDD